MEKKLLENENGVQWFSLNGEDFGTGVIFENEVFGVYNDGALVDSENYPLDCESDWKTIAVRNSL